MSRILIVEDDVVLARALKNWLERERLQVTCAITASNARRIIVSEEVDIILSDLRLPDGDGIELLEWLQKNRRRIPLIIMTQHAEVSSAIRAMKAGAEDYLPKPIHPEMLYSKLNDVLLRTRKMKRKQTDILQRVSQPIREVERRARLVAATDMSVLIRGENGSGKELVADLIHRASARDDKPFVAVDCGAIPKELAASEFFGYVKGAFTGAIADKSGVFHTAEGGTLFLDEIGNLPYEVQTLLLRALQERRYRPIGSRREYPCDVRIVAATNENIERAIADGRFREDLYHRLNEFTIELPPLRECADDILPLAEFFLAQFCEQNNRQITGFSFDAVKRLQTYGWPGNVRELRNTIRKAALLSNAETIDEADLDLPSVRNTDSYALKGEQEERARIIKALEAAKYNKALAAELLRISRPTLYEKMKKYGISTEKQ
ncbi:sigma-54 dependent transcriptional regulator [Alistipes sp.]|uniref:sigma-54-dependent transcriptional regulator n=1 Tax=Alistipes sp. TaxID=1872444 RepID=UPI0025BD577D|nr:sigma-54 dependent transcriptional regulator [Alistipes sp.]